MVEEGLWRVADTVEQGVGSALRLDSDVVEQESEKVEQPFVLLAKTKHPDNKKQSARKGHGRVGRVGEG